MESQDNQRLGALATGLLKGKRHYRHRCRSTHECVDVAIDAFACAVIQLSGIVFTQVCHMMAIVVKGARRSIVCQ